MDVSLTAIQLVTRILQGVLSFLDLFVPLMGRVGADAPADHIIATVVAVLTFLCLPGVLALSHRFGVQKLERILLTLAALSAVAIAIFVQPSWAAFDRLHPKRVLSLQ